jgi:hypothetical protein
MLFNSAIAVFWLSLFRVFAIPVSKRRSHVPKPPRPFPTAAQDDILIEYFPIARAL